MKLTLRTGLAVMCVGAFPAVVFAKFGGGGSSILSLSEADQRHIVIGFWLSILSGFLVGFAGWWFPKPSRRVVIAMVIALVHSGYWVVRQYLWNPADAAVSSGVIALAIVTLALIGCVGGLVAWAITCRVHARVTRPSAEPGRVVCSECGFHHLIAVGRCPRCTPQTTRD